MFTYGNMQWYPFSPVNRDGRAHVHQFHPSHCDVTSGYPSHAYLSAPAPLECSNAPPYIRKTGSIEQLDIEKVLGAFEGNHDLLSSAIHAALHSVPEQHGFHGEKGETLPLATTCPPKTLNQQCQLRLPSIKTTHMAANVMSEECDLGYSSFSDIALFPEVPDITNCSGNSDDLFEDITSSFDETFECALGTESIAKPAVTISDVSVKQEPNQVNRPNYTASHFKEIPHCQYPGYVNEILPISSCAFFSSQVLITDSPVATMTANVKNSVPWCVLCDKSFQTRSALKMHMASHRGNRPHWCPYCDKSFTQKSTLRTHIRVHTGEKPYACEQCTRAFGDYSTFRKHVRIHTGERPYTCDVCQKGFTQSGNMLRHREVHFKKSKKVKCEKSL
ncbi:zinc finger protein 177-like [Dreissena polymorpha]|uniref:C2H2-type domain-containing protein n=1 Tax=Dreissena polymorpha TaxID=45954 RepID=A0A9D4EZB4_DREPO|nr:zinc finger protein 177-like [Dreissena polymorpha]KAH3788997.1 hypothetical protein DPMN_167164 [Dreissena polymorpha]